MRSEKIIKTVLIIDDDIDDYLLVMDAVKQIDSRIVVYFVKSCEEAMQYRDHKIDLVFLDINMPLYDGFTWLKAIRDRGYNDLPVVMYTNSLSPEHIRKAYDEGANLYFVKPDSFNQLLRGLKELVTLDWSDPFSIKEKYKHKGIYGTFSF